MGWKYKELLLQIKQEFKLDFYGDHGIHHWERVFQNTQKLANHYEVQSEVFELFSLLHDCKREDEFTDIQHGKRASAFAQALIENKTITLNDIDKDRLIYACSNHTVTNKKNPLYNDLIVQICFDSDRLDIGRVGITPSVEYMSTDYGKVLTLEV